MNFPSQNVAYIFSMKCPPPYPLSLDYSHLKSSLSFFRCTLFCYRIVANNPANETWAKGFRALSDYPFTTSCALPSILSLASDLLTFSLLTHTQCVLFVAKPPVKDLPSNIYELGLFRSWTRCMQALIFSAT